MEKFGEAQRLMPESPDPELGLARVYVYGLKKRQRRHVTQFKRFERAGPGPTQIAAGSGPRLAKLPALYLRSPPDSDAVLRSSKKHATARSHRCPALVSEFTWRRLWDTLRMRVLAARWSPMWA